MSKRSSRNVSAYQTKYPFLRITGDYPTKGDLKWAQQVFPVEGFEGSELMLAEAAVDGITDEVIETATSKGLWHTTVMAVVSAMYLNMHNGSVSSRDKKVYRRDYSLTVQDTVPNILVVGDIDKCHLLVRVCEELVSANPLVPDVEETSFEGSGLMLPPLVARNFLREVVSPDMGSDALYLSVSASGVDMLFAVDPPTELIISGSSADHRVDERTVVDAVLSVDDGVTTISDTAKGRLLDSVAQTIPFRVMASRYASANGFSERQVLIVCSVLQSVTVLSPNAFKVVLTGDTRRVEELIAVSVAVWGWGMSRIASRAS